jgi:hypothetical protein
MQTTIFTGVYQAMMHDRAIGESCTIRNKKVSIMGRGD